MKYTRRNPKPKPRRKSTVSIPERAHPLARLVFAEIRRQNFRYQDLEDGSGVKRATLKAWRHKNRPSMENLEAVLSFLNFNLIPVPQARVLPSEIREELGAVAERLGLYAANDRGARHHGRPTTF